MTTPWNQLLAPLVGGPFVLPPSGPEFQPVCGHRNGLFIGIAPMPGPRGLIRIYTPYLGHPPGRMINYVAVEPIPAGQRRRGFPNSNGAASTTSLANASRLRLITS